MEGVEATSAQPAVTKAEVDHDQEVIPEPREMAVPLVRAFDVPASSATLGGPTNGLKLEHRSSAEEVLGRQSISLPQIGAVHPSGHEQLVKNGNNSADPLPRSTQSFHQAPRGPRASDEVVAYGPIKFESTNAFAALCGPRGEYAKEIVHVFPSLRIRYDRASGRGRSEGTVEAYIEVVGLWGRDQAQSQLIKSQINAVERGLRAFKHLDRPGGEIDMPLGVFLNLYPELFQPGALADAQSTLKEADPSVQPRGGHRERPQAFEQRRASGQRTRSRSPRRYGHPVRVSIAHCP